MTLDSLLEGELAPVPEGIAPLVQVLYQEATRCLSDFVGGKKIARRLTRCVSTTKSSCMIDDLAWSIWRLRPLLRDLS